MKKVLIITYYWPPSGGAGVQRWLKFSKYLRNFGWEPVIYTPENPEAPVIDDSLKNDVPDGTEVIKRPIWEPYDFYKRFIGLKKDSKINAGFLTESEKPKFSENLSVWIRGNLFIPDARRFWIKPSVKFLSTYLKDNPVDAMVSTGPPHSMHMIALKLKEKLNIPWLADFRDPWTNIDFYEELKLTRLADRMHRKEEKQVLKIADKVSVISNGMAGDFKSIHERDYAVITNGFDPEDFSYPSKAELDEDFTISHIGTMVKSRNPETLWKVLASLINENESFGRKLKIKLVGKVDREVVESIVKNGLIKHIEKIDYVPHREVVELQQRSHVLLLLINDTPNAKLILTGKFFEYLAAKRPVLCIGPEDGDASRIIRDLDAGYACNYRDAGKIRSSLLGLYQKYASGDKFGYKHDINKFSRKNLTKEMADLLNSIV